MTGDLVGGTDPEPDPYLGAPDRLTIFKVTTLVEVEGQKVAYQVTYHRTYKRTIIDVGVAVGQHQEIVNLESFVGHYLEDPSKSNVTRIEAGR